MSTETTAEFSKLVSEGGIRAACNSDRANGAIWFEGEAIPSPRQHNYDLADCFTQYTRTAGVLPTTNAKALMLSVGISESWLRAGGTRADPERARQFMREALAWANKEIGGVWAGWCDGDMAAGDMGYVNMMASPAKEHFPFACRRIDVDYALINLTRHLPVAGVWREGQSLQQEAMRRSWNLWAKDTLDRTIEHPHHLSDVEKAESLAHAKGEAPSADGPNRQDVGR